MTAAAQDRIVGGTPHHGRIRVGVLGTSEFARRRMMAAIRGHPGAELAAVASRDPARAAHTAAQHGCAAAADYGELLARDDIDAVYLPLPNALHHEWALAAMESGKHVLAEKPLTTSAADTAELVGVAARTGRVLRENFCFLHHGQHRTVRDLLRGGRIGRLRRFTGAFCIPPRPAADVRHRPELGGGALLDTGVYPIRAAQFFLGDDLSVTGALLRQDAATGVDVGGSALLRAAGGEIVTVDFGFEHGYGSLYQLWGSEGRLTLERAFTPPPDLAPVLRVDRQGEPVHTVLPAEDQYAATVGAFAAAVRRARDLGTDPDHQAWAAAAVRTAELVEEISRCAQHITVETRERG
ncbi:Gfo/Idh/MocA family protein [Streptomyces cyanogenus]|uniref:1,5-anhydro-D-fructose reductase n=1 Tax=Streptomyces cyanogenus TaxID=80860 RepID=A0ABX7TM69_STRCY|nr:Gfo/Idh/MocA family oxidoreductase [Streptomyces cyanogenus]QTD96693.1 1,5-anhydro-D-fructose reductase [Streptomyces cyanogenus]